MRARAKGKKRYTERREKHPERGRNTHAHTATPTSISPHKALRELNEPAFNNLSAAVKIKTPYGESQDQDQA